MHPHGCHKPKSTEPKRVGSGGKSPLREPGLEDEGGPRMQAAGARGLGAEAQFQTGCRVGRWLDLRVLKDAPGCHKAPCLPTEPQPATATACGYTLMVLNAAVHWTLNA